MVSFHRALPLQSGLGKGEQRAELRGLGPGGKDCDPNLLSRYAGQAGDPQAKLVLPSKLKKTFISCVPLKKTVTTNNVKFLNMANR